MAIDLTAAAVLAATRRLVRLTTGLKNMLMETRSDRLSQCGGLDLDEEKDSGKELKNRKTAQQSNNC